MPTYPAAWRSAWRQSSRGGPAAPISVPDVSHRVTMNSGRYAACEVEGCGNQVLRNGPHTRCRIHRGAKGQGANYIHISICHDKSLD